MYEIAMMHDGDGHMMAVGWMTGWMLLWALLAVALLVLAVVATVWLVRHLPGGREQSRATSSVEVLERRYAAGEIDREDFLQRRHDLSRS